MKQVQQASSEVSVLPTQLREIMEAERMAKQQKGYDNFDIDIDDDDVKPDSKK
ncbi:hypothetical protein ANCCEY_00902 [Ancylostoma ceylanicum]|uniref:Uncharacterized protein n=1 Tax=Ancylostoma ceylanicum TaxID=53326 RepID=A0A0D6M7D6_9BILA|nr:hypothetical protein ANCCEY_00902 [Ancylostoma ceylanicum]